MNKELEALERLAMPDELHIKECKKLGIGLTEDFDTIEQALQRLDKYEQILSSGRLTDRNYKNTTLDLDSCKPYLRLGQLEDVYEESRKMDKEVVLKSLDEIKELVNDDKKFKYKNIVNFNCKPIEKELETIEKYKNTDAIDNYEGFKNDDANLREALGCLECMYCEPEDYRGNDRAKDYKIIKNYILKTQESKQYLKWEDLKFREEKQTMQVLLNGKEYKLSYFTDGIYKFIDLLTDKGKYQIYRYVDCYSYEVQFFNDLHLEVAK